MTIRLVCLNADDTLWHNMRHFAFAEATLAHLLAPHAPPEQVRTVLDAREIRDLPLYGYGTRGFTLSMIETALDVAGPELRPNTTRAILGAGCALLAHSVQLLDGVAETLTALASRARLVLITKGDLLRQEAKLAASSLAEHFTGIEIVSAKTAETYRRVLARYDTLPHRAIMAGDPVRSDILPALEAGAFAAYLPQAGGWTHEHAEVPDHHSRFHRLATIDMSPGLIGQLST